MRPTWCHGFVISQLLLTVVAQTPSPSASTGAVPDPNRVTPGFLGFLFTVVLVVAAVILYYSLRKQLRKIDFDEDATVEPVGGQAGDDIDSVEPGNSRSG